MTIPLALLLGCHLAGPTTPSVGVDIDAPPTEPPPRRAASAGLSEPPSSLRCDSPSARALECFVRVPGGSFLRGAQADEADEAHHDPAAAQAEGPVSRVTVAPFWIQRFEVGVGTFGRCLSDEWCKPEELDQELFAADLAASRGSPVRAITWEGARQVCEWLGGRLPTEAEWELAARGTDGRRFPWGDEPGCGVRVPFGFDTAGQQRSRDDMRRQDCALNGPVPPDELWGAGPWGTMGMAGNVWEWTADPWAWYDGTDADPARRVQRGGGWTSSDPLELRAAGRVGVPATMKLNDVGVRCAWDAR